VEKKGKKKEKKTEIRKPCSVGGEKKKRKGRRRGKKKPQTFFVFSDRLVAARTGKEGEQLKTPSREKGKRKKEGQPMYSLQIVNGQRNSCRHRSEAVTGGERKKGDGLVTKKRKEVKWWSSH